MSTDSVRTPPFIEDQKPLHLRLEFLLLVFLYLLCSINGAGKLEAHWVNPAFSPAPGLSALLGVDGGGREPGLHGSCVMIGSFESPF